MEAGLGTWTFDLIDFRINHKVSNEPLTQPMLTSIHGTGRQEAQGELLIPLPDVGAYVSLFDRADTEWKSVLRYTEQDLPTSEQSIRGYIHYLQKSDMLGATFVLESDELSRILRTVEVALLTSEQRTLRLTTKVYFRADGVDIPEASFEDFYSSGRAIYFKEFSIGLIPKETP